MRVRPERLSPLTCAKLGALVPLFVSALVEIGALLLPSGAAVAAAAGSGVGGDGRDGRLALAALLVPALEALTYVRAS